MAAILGVFNRHGPPLTVPHVRRMADRMAARGHDRHGAWRDGLAALAVTRHEAELSGNKGGAVFVAHDGRLTVVADAVLEGSGELQRRLRSVGLPIFDTSPSQLILGAYRAWGDDCASAIAGEFAFLVWDGTARRVFGARDASGNRPLFYATVADAFVVASTAEGVLGHPETGAASETVAPVEVRAGGWFAWNGTAVLEGERPACVTSAPMSVAQVVA